MAQTGQNLAFSMQRGYWLEKRTHRRWWWWWWLISAMGPPPSVLQLHPGFTNRGQRCTVECRCIWCTVDVVVNAGCADTEAYFQNKMHCRQCYIALSHGPGEQCLLLYRSSSAKLKCCSTKTMLWLKTASWESLADDSVQCLTPVSLVTLYPLK